MATEDRVLDSRDYLLLRRRVELVQTGRTVVVRHKTMNPKRLEWFVEDEAFFGVDFAREEFDRVVANLDAGERRAKAARANPGLSLAELERMVPYAH